MGRRGKQRKGTPRREREPSPEEKAIWLAVGARLRGLRESLNWTQSEMAKKCGLSKVHYAVIELAKKAASLEMIARVSQGTGVAPADLLRFDDPPIKRVAETPAERFGRRVTALARGRDEELLDRVERVVRVMLEERPAAKKGKGRKTP